MNERIKGTQQPYPTTSDVPVYNPETMSTEQLTQAVLNAGADTNRGEQNGTK